MADLVPNMDEFGYSEAVDPSVSLAPTDYAMLSAFQLPPAPLASAFGPMKVDANMYAPQQSGTPFDILSNIGRRMQYDAAVKQAEENRNAYGQAMSNYKTQIEQAKQEAALKKRREVAVASAEAALQRGELQPEEVTNYINGVMAGATPAPLIRGKGIGTQIAEAEDQKSTKAFLEKEVAQAKGVQTLTDRAMKLINEADPAMFQVEGRVTAGVKDFASKFKSLQGVPEIQQTPEDKKFLAYYRKLSATAQALKSTFLKSTSGATVTDKEMARIDNVLPVIDGVVSFDSLDTAKAKMQEFQQIQRAVLARYEFMRKQGVLTPTTTPQEAQDAAEGYPLESFMEGNTLQQQTTPQRTVVRTGIDKKTGRKVIQYSDGSLEYGN